MLEILKDLFINGLIGSVFGMIVFLAIKRNQHKEMKKREKRDEFLNN